MITLQFGVFDPRCGGQRFRHRSLAEGMQHGSTPRSRRNFNATQAALRRYKPLWKAPGTGHVLAELAAKNGQMFQMLMICMNHGDVLTRSRCVILRRGDAKTAKKLGDCHGIPLSNGKGSRALHLFC